MLEHLRGLRRNKMAKKKKKSKTAEPKPIIISFKPLLKARGVRKEWRREVASTIPELRGVREEIGERQSFFKGDVRQASTGRAVGEKGKLISLKSEEKQMKRLEKKGKKEKGIAREVRGKYEKSEREVLKERQKVGVKIEKKIGRKIKGLQKRPLVSKKVVRKAPRATLDLRIREREPLKQHGFKEVEISNSNFLFN